MLYLLLLLAHLFAALIFIGTVFFEVLILGHLHQHLPIRVMVLVEQGVEPDAAAADGRTALMMAAMFNRTAIVDYLLEQGADPRRRDGRGIDALGAAQAMGATDTSAQLQALA